VHQRGHLKFWTAAVFTAAVLLCAPFSSRPGFAQAADAEAMKRGEYIFNAGGCASCHTDEKNKGPPLAGGPAIKTPFGTFYGPNITPHPSAGIGDWTEANFVRAMREGIAPEGVHFFPVFPFTSFTKIREADLKDLWTYLRSVPASDVPSKPHDVAFPFNIRLMQFFWKKLFFTPGEFQPDPAKPPEVNRGAYLAEGLSHCGECHTPRNLLGGLERTMAYAGTRDGPGGEKVPNITPDPETGIGKWSDGDLIDVLKNGMTPDGDFVGSVMAEVVRNTTSKLSDADLRAIIAYLKTLPPIRNDLRAKKPG
jgi:mono/diheme cytochrome c family protein